MSTHSDHPTRLIDIPLGHLRIRHTSDRRGASTLVEVVAGSGARVDGAAAIKIVVGEHPADGVAHLVGAAQSAVQAAETAFFSADESGHPEVFSAYGKILSAATEAEKESRRLAHAVALARHLHRQEAPADFGLPEARRDRR